MNEWNQFKTYNGVIKVRQGLISRPSQNNTQTHKNRPLCELTENNVLSTAKGFQRKTSSNVTV